ncbi:uracil phosphoribosyltransferase-domain-containing protein [Truncatella angustata]|uniref:Uracil phosphoribosyltransferase-domain-containing protein n=1 Tax=Truncatella angustata TaxID=152316 RepID=A0A9P8REM2_9PEZI|nr:uracil phosphoribosyltransferase-domain-containing protein [Truncatella angustata]KAH6640053.1 uracil phosphoribosyltransferase-domain-containing protein [Truncatella angustata]
MGPEIEAAAVDVKDKPTIIGLYGVSGSGKTHLLNQLSSAIIGELVPGGLDSFKKADVQEQLYWRELAIRTISDKCSTSGSVGIVAGHFMFWSGDETMAPEHVCTEADLNTYTHILYLEVPADVVAKRRRADEHRCRPEISPENLQRWQDAEIDGLRYVCHNRGILFHVLHVDESALGPKVLQLCKIFQLTEVDYRTKINDGIDEMVFEHDDLETMLVLDADKTLAEVDTGVLFWQRVQKNMLPQANGKLYTLQRLFGGPLGYSLNAFLQTALLHEEIDSERKFETLCEDVASGVTMYREFVSMLEAVVAHKHVGIIVLTCGLQLVWEKILRKAGLLGRVKVIGNGRIDHDCLVTPDLKATAVRRLRNHHHISVWAFGDSPLDLPMLKEADQAIVVVGDEYSRSKSMETALANAIGVNGFKARQTLLPHTGEPRLDQVKLPVVQLSDQDLLDNIVGRRFSDRLGAMPGKLHVFEATEKDAAKLLMTPTRDAQLAGPLLREAHRRVGWYLAVDLLTSVIGLEDYLVPHVQGHQTNGFRLCAESRTIIVALMRGGEPMALGVNDAFPLASFLHAHRPGDLKLQHLVGHDNVILVDSVVNSGKTLVDFVQHVRSLAVNTCIVIVSGVVQAGAIAIGNPVRDALVREGDVSLVALRVSENKFTGRGTTDTGNRLFNTTQLE